MRKENSAFRMKYLSQPGANSLHNNDFFGCSELDRFACYVVADGFRSGNDKFEDPSARLAVEAVIAAFNLTPSVGRRAVARYLDAAHRALKENNGNKRLRASLTVVVTDYQKLRYGFAGNCRFQLYRSGKVLTESGDHSLSWEMMEEGQLPKDKIASHAERNNLSVYCGTLKSFHPTISKMIKLKNLDIFSLFTRGIWENAHTIDLLAAVRAAENDPEAAVTETERIILDKLPAKAISENYTICYVFVDKVFLDPDEKKRRRRIIIIAVIAVIVVVVVIVAIVLYNRWRARTENDMQLAYHNGTEYIHGDNFIRAKEELEAAYALAEKLWDKKHKNDINNYILLVDAIVFADDLFAKKEFEQAVDAYGEAANQSRYADNLSSDYIESHRKKAAGYWEVREDISIGNSLADAKDFDHAEKRYLAARSLASRLYDTEGKQEANDALTALIQLKQEETDAQKEQAQAEVAAAEYIVEGDKALRDGDLVAAKLYYTMAREKYAELGSDAIVTVVDEKMGLLDMQETQNEYQLEYAADYMQAGDEMAEAGEYIDAKRLYLLAREIYANLGEAEKLKEVEAKIEMVDLYLVAGAATSNRAESGGEG